MLFTVVFLMNVGGSCCHFGAVDLQKVYGFQRTIACLGCMKRAGVFLTVRPPLSESLLFLSKTEQTTKVSSQRIHPSVWKNSLSNEKEVTPGIWYNWNPCCLLLILTASLHLLMPCFAYLKSQPVTPGMYNANVKWTSGMDEIGGWKMVHIVGKDLSKQK